MADFPTGLDDLTNPLGTDQLDSPPHATQHAEANDVLEALEAKVGIDSSAVETSHDFLIAANTTKVSAAGSIKTHSDVSSTDTPVVNDVIKHNGSEFVFSPYDTNLDLTIDTFADNQTNTQLIGAGQWLAIAGWTATSTYTNGPPSAATVDLSITTAWDTGSSGWTDDQLTNTTPFAAWTSTEILNYPSSPNQTITFTINTTPTKSDTEAVVFPNTVLYGASTTAQGAHDQASLAALTENGANEDQSISKTITPGASDYVVFAYPDRISNILQVRIGSITASFNATSTTLAPDITELVSFTNSAGYVENYRVITSRLTNIDATAGTSVVTYTSSSALNHIEWGASTTQSSFTGTDIYNIATDTGLEDNGGGKSASDTEARSVTATAGASEYIVFAHPTRNGTLAQFRLGGITAAFNPADATAVTPAYETVAVTNRAGYTEDYKVYASDVANLSTFSAALVSTSSTQEYNNVYWGELNVDATGDGGNVYSAANVTDNNASASPIIDTNETLSSQSMVVNCTVAEYAYIAYPARLGVLTSISIGGFESISDFWIDAGSGTELAITNDAGFTENYYVYVSKNPGFTDPTTMLVSN